MNTDNIEILKRNFDYCECGGMAPDDYAKALLSNYIRVRDSHVMALAKYNNDIKTLKSLLDDDDCNTGIDPSHINDESGFSCGGGCD